MVLVQLFLLLLLFCIFDGLFSIKDSLESPGENFFSVNNKGIGTSKRSLAASSGRYLQILKILCVSQVSFVVTNI